MCSHKFGRVHELEKTEVDPVLRYYAAIAISRWLRQVRLEKVKK
jgi:hypothetical protein